MPQFSKLLLFFMLFFSSYSNIHAQREVLTIEELFERIAESAENDFVLKDAHITKSGKIGDNVDLDITIKNIVFENVLFDKGISFWKVKFGSLTFINCTPLQFVACTFWGKFSILVDSLIDNSVIPRHSSTRYSNSFYGEPNSYAVEPNSWEFDFCFFSHNIPTFNITGKKDGFKPSLFLSSCEIKTKGFNNEEGLYNWRFRNTDRIVIDANEFIFEKGKSKFIDSSSFESLAISIENSSQFRFNQNKINEGNTILEIGMIDIINVDFDNGYPLILRIDKLDWNDDFYISQVANLYSLKNYQTLLNDMSSDLVNVSRREPWTQPDSLPVIRSYSITREDYLSTELALLGVLEDHYKSKHNLFRANIFYYQKKWLETQRFKYLYKKEKSFENYFQWKLNVFLRFFSDFGTKPAKAIVIALYVILIFAFVYLLFPNSWDENNRHRIMNRMLFFTKYFKRKEGMKEVFEEEQKSHIMAYEDFKSFISESKDEIPPYFLTLSKPIYYFSVANFRVRSKVLSKADILKGKWVDLNPRRKVVTSIIMAFWLLGILLYDLFVKFFNALMLSINTFSTLGFGEIPIKGIPRYLAILQGFLGWFMLSIFSVSLISQLLN